MEDVVFFPMGFTNGEGGGKRESPDEDTQTLSWHVKTLIGAFILWMFSFYFSFTLCMDRQHEHFLCLCIIRPS